MKNLDVVAIGNANIDLILKVPRLLKNDDKVVGKKLAETVGGTVANCACVMGNLGLKVASLSVAGTDHYGEKIINDFKRFNVNTDFVDIVPGVEANMAVILLDESAEKSLIYVPGEEPPVSKTRYKEVISLCKAVYTMPGNVDEFEKFASVARECEAQVAIDIEPHIADTPEKLSRILKLADIVFFNLDGFITCVGEQPDKASLTALCQRYQLDTVVVTCGGKGAIAVNKWGYSEHPGYPVSIIDTTGAGDTFNGSFVYSLINHYPLDKALEFSCACAAMSTAYLGARGDIPSVEKVQRFIEQNQPTSQQ